MSSYEDKLQQLKDKEQAFRLEYNNGDISFEEYSDFLDEIHKEQNKIERYENRKKNGVVGKIRKWSNVHDC